MTERAAEWVEETGAAAAVDAHATVAAAELLEDVAVGGEGEDV